MIEVRLCTGTNWTLVQLYQRLQPIPPRIDLDLSLGWLFRKTQIDTRVARLLNPQLTIHGLSNCLIKKECSSIKEVPQEKLAKSFQKPKHLGLKNKHVGFLRVIWVSITVPAPFHLNLRCLILLDLHNRLSPPRDTVFRRLVSHFLMKQTRLVKWTFAFSSWASLKA